MVTSTGGLPDGQKLGSGEKPVEITAGPPFSEAVILDQTQRITKSKLFAGSPRLCRFLNWTVEQTLKNGGEDIKQYVVAREVFERGVDFDPRIDSIVRTEAQRLRRKLGEYYEDGGRSDPVQIYFEPGRYVARFRSRSGPRESNSKQAVAVLPFENLTGNADLTFFCRGMTESIQQRLATVPGLKVISSSSSFRVGPRSAPATTASKLGASSIVRGTIQQASDRIRVHANVIEPASGSYIWARVFERNIADVFAIQDEIASSVADALTVEFPIEQTAAWRPTPSIEAYTLYLQGRYYWNQLSPAGCQKAADCFTRAILQFPEYAEPYAALADAYFWLIWLSCREPLDLLESAKQSALKAVYLDPKCAEAYVALGTLAAVFESRWDEGERLFRQGLELRPSSVSALTQRAFARLQTGDLEGARLDQKTALELDPLSPRCYRSLAVTSYLARDYDSALMALERALKIRGDVKSTYYLRGLVLLQAGEHQKAIEALRCSVRGNTPGLHLGSLVAAYARSGEEREARRTLRKLEELETDSFVSPVAFVHAYVGMGNYEKALEWLDQAAYRRFGGLMNVKLDPCLDCLRGEARFKAVLERTGSDLS
ncbi:MAG: tetratricopeptide repeat protein [Bryobacteraceae bacterium]